MVLSNNIVWPHKEFNLEYKVLGDNLQVLLYVEWNCGKGKLPHLIQYADMIFLSNKRTSFTIDYYKIYTAINSILKVILSFFIRIDYSEIIFPEYFLEISFYVLVWFAWCRNVILSFQNHFFVCRLDIQIIQPSTRCPITTTIFVTQLFMQYVEKSSCESY